MKFDFPKFFRRFFGKKPFSDSRDRVALPDPPPPPRFARVEKTCIPCWGKGRRGLGVEDGIVEIGECPDCNGAGMVVEMVPILKAGS